MSGSTRNTRNPPDYYFKLTTKQQRNWRRNARRDERNEELRNRYSPYRPASNIRVVHLHHRTDLHTIEQLIEQAKATKRYTIDTESTTSRHGNRGALVQIELIRDNDHSTVVLLEAAHLPEPSSLHSARIEEFWSVVFDGSNEIITWGTLHDELKDFQHIHWMRIGNSRPINLQFLFQAWQSGRLTHPETERRVTTTGVSIETPGEYSDDEDWPASDDEPKQPWSLQSTVATTLQSFLDKAETVNHWGCGLDRSLNTWQRKLFSRRYYDAAHEQQQRIKMINYAVHDCTSVSELYFKIYPWEANTRNPTTNIRPTMNTSPTIMETPKTTPAIPTSHNDENNDNDDDGFSRIRFPQFNSPAPNPSTSDETDFLIINAPTIDIDEPTIDIDEPRQSDAPMDIEHLKKKHRKPTKEQQRHKNMKRKEKQRTRASYQNKLTRPLYNLYDFRKVRAQLLDDNLHTTHQITINRERNEVRIGFKSPADLDHARSIIRANYFSKDQYESRWSGSGDQRSTNSNDRRNDRRNDTHQRSERQPTNEDERRRVATTTATARRPIEQRHPDRR